MAIEVTHVQVGTATKPKGFSPLPCPHCGCAEANVMIDLANLEDLRCNDCDAEYTVSDVRQIVAKWSAVLKWIDSAP